MNKHTPGPWTAFYKVKYDEWHVSVPVEGSTMKMTLFDEGIRTEPIKREADAHLIAAAPELYEALEMALPRLAHVAQCAKINPAENWLEHGSWDFSGCVCEISKARAALAKARGETA